MVGELRRRWRADFSFAQINYEEIALDASDVGYWLDECRRRLQLPTSIRPSVLIVKLNVLGSGIDVGIGVARKP
jgi:hypothetical protein